MENVQESEGRGAPIWQPVEGVTLDRYAELTAALARRGLTGEDEVEEWLATQGIPPSTWAVVQSAWIHRMAADAAVRARYGAVFSRYGRVAGEAR